VAEKRQKREGRKLLLAGCEPGFESGVHFFEDGIEVLRTTVLDQYLIRIFLRIACASNSNWIARKEHPHRPSVSAKLLGTHSEATSPQQRSHCRHSPWSDRLHGLKKPETRGCTPVYTSSLFALSRKRFTGDIGKRSIGIAKAYQTKGKLF
jgi:hypothetical protein